MIDNDPTMTAYAAILVLCAIVLSYVSGMVWEWSKWRNIVAVRKLALPDDETGDLFWAADGEPVP